MDNYNYDENDNNLPETDEQHVSAQNNQDPYGTQQYAQNNQNPYQTQQHEQNICYNGNGYNNGFNQQYGAYGQVNPNYYAVPRKKNPFGTASLVFGLLAMPGCYTVWFGIIFSIAAIVCAIISRINYGKFEGKSIAGLILGIMFLLFSLLLFFMVIMILENPELMEEFNRIMEEYEEYYNTTPFDGNKSHTLQIILNSIIR